jgi:hypothetical protein
MDQRVLITAGGAGERSCAHSRRRETRFCRVEASTAERHTICARDALAERDPLGGRLGLQVLVEVRQVADVDEIEFEMRRREGCEGFGELAVD